MIYTRLLKSGIRKKILFLLLIICFTAAGRAQGYAIKYLDISMGLSNNSVTAIYQDKEGYMWLGTYDGLNRYDGYGFKIFRNEIKNHKSLASSSVFCINGDSKNHIWIGGASGGSIYNPTASSFERLSLGTANNYIYDAIFQIEPANDSLVLAGCDKSGLVVFKTGSPIGKAVPLHHRGKRINQYNVMAIEPVASKKFCWVYIKQYGLYKLWTRDLSLEFIAGTLKQPNVIRQEKGGILWLGTDDGLYKFDPRTGQYSQNQLPGKYIVMRIRADRHSDLYIATDGSGVFRAGKNRTFSPFKAPAETPLLKSAVVWDIFEDRDGNKWFGTLRGGVSMIGGSLRNFKHVRTVDDNAAANYTLSLCEDQNKKVWMGTDGAGIRIWDRERNSFTKITTAQGLSSNFVAGLACDFTNTIWAATWNGGINKISAATGQIRHYDLIDPKTKQLQKNIWLIFQDREKMLWAASARGGMLYFYNREKDLFELYNSKLSDLLCMAEGRDGTIWTGNFEYLYGINKKTNTYSTQQMDYPVRCIVEDNKGILWIGTSEGGLLKYNPQSRSFRRYSTKEGLPGNTILRLLMDKSGNLWASTYNGLSMLDPKRNTFRNFSVSDGLQSNQFSFNAGLELSTGEFMFGGINGSNIFSPQSITKVGHSPKLLLDDIIVNNTSIKGRSGYFQHNPSGPESIILPYDQTAVSLDYLALDYENADKIKYAYLLEGWDTQWIAAGNSRKANYSRIAEGNYTFKVKATNQYGEWGKPTALLEIQVLPPWYRSWWAYVLYALATVGLLLIYMRYNKYKERMRYEVKLAQLDKVKEKELSEKQASMFTYISHEFRTPLSLIINPLKSVIRQQDQKGEPIRELSVAHRNARRLLSLVDQLLLFKRAENDADELSLTSVDMNFLCQEVYQCFTQQAKEQQIQYELDMPEHILHIIGDYEKIEICLFNLVSNAFKYTPLGGTIKIILTESSSEVATQISDTGFGIPEEEKKHIFEKFRQANLKSSPGKGFGIGLFIVKYFVDKHKGLLDFESTHGQGSSFTLRFRKGSEHFAELPIREADPKMSELVRELAAEINEQDQASLQESAVPFVEQEIDTQLVSEKKSILIIDDNTEIREYLVQLFSPLYLVYSADNGLDGLRLANKSQPDVILSDIAMDGMNGLELCKRIKQSDTLNHILVILLTAATSQKTQLQGISEGADDYITKPFDDEILKAKVETLLRNRMQLRNYFLDNITLREHHQKVPAEYRDFLKRCISVIESNLNEEQFTIKQFSQAMGMSHSALYTKIKAISGQTLNGFIRSVRIRHAAVLMLTGDIRVSQAASRVGFEDRKHFREQFVKLFGMTPSEYIKKYRNSFNKDLNIIQK